MKIGIMANNKAIVSSQGQVVIPKAVREKLAIHAGNELLFKAHPDGVLEVMPVARSIEMFFGRCKRVTKSAMSMGEIDEAIGQAASESDY